LYTDKNVQLTQSGIHMHYHTALSSLVELSQKRINLVLMDAIIIRYFCAIIFYN